MISGQKNKQIQAEIIEQYTAKATSVNQPVVIILGAQPGAGKTELEKVAREELSNNVVVCNADLFRDMHPKADQIKNEYEAKYPEITAPYSMAWNKGLREYCEANKLNYILETTFSSGDAMNQTIADLKAKDYQVRIKLLAVNPLISLLGTYMRFEQMKNREGAGRLVGKEAHDQRFNKIPDTIKSVQSIGLYDDFKIYARNFDDRRQLNLMADNPQNALHFFLQEVNKEWSEELKAYFEREVQHVILLMRTRSAPAKEMAEFKNAISSGQTYQSDIQRQNETSKEQQTRRKR